MDAGFVCNNYSMTAAMLKGRGNIVAILTGLNWLSIGSSEHISGNNEQSL